MSSIFCLSAAFCSILRVPVSGCSSSIGETPAAQGRHFGSADYIAGRLEAAFATARRIADGPIPVIGYCARAGSRSRYVASVKPPVLRCSRPLDFMPKVGRLCAWPSPPICSLASAVGAAVCRSRQTLFFILDPFTAERKFTRFAILDSETTGA